MFLVYLCVFKPEQEKSFQPDFKLFSNKKETLKGFVCESQKLRKSTSGKYSLYNVRRSELNKLNYHILAEAL